MTTSTGMIYLLHFDAPGPGGARHYLGYTEDIGARLEAHRSGRGSRLTKAIRRLGIGFRLVLTYTDATRADERRLKQRHQAARLCPACRPWALEKHAARERAARRAKQRKRETVHA